MTWYRKGIPKYGLRARESQSLLCEMALAPEKKPPDSFAIPAFLQQGSDEQMHVAKWERRP